MATGDILLSVAVEGGSTKSVALTSETRVKAKLVNDSASPNDLSGDDEWAAFIANTLAGIIVSDANSQLKTEASWTPVTFTEAS